MERLPVMFIAPALVSGAVPSTELEEYEEIFVVVCGPRIAPRTPPLASEPTSMVTLSIGPASVSVPPPLRSITPGPPSADCTVVPPDRI